MASSRNRPYFNLSANQLCEEIETKLIPIHITNVKVLHNHVVGPIVSLMLHIFDPDKQIDKEDNKRRVLSSQGRLLQQKVG